MTIGSILITGGTSLVGSAIIRQTKIESKYSTVHPIVAFSRNAKPESSASLVHYVRGNVFDTISLQTVIRNKPHIVHTVGLDEQEGCDSSIIVANALADRCADIDGRRFPDQRRSFIFFSVADGFPSLIFNQDFVQWKRQAENALLGVKLESKIRVVIFRPGIIYSYHRRFGILLFVFGLYLTGLFLRPLKSYIPRDLHFLADLPILDDDIAKAVFEAIEDTNVEGICDGDRIRRLAKAWEAKKMYQGELSAGYI